MGHWSAPVGGGGGGGGGVVPASDRFERAGVQFGGIVKPSLGRQIVVKLLRVLCMLFEINKTIEVDSRIVLETFNFNDVQRPQS